MITSAQALEEIEKMEREAAAAHDPARMGFSGMISTAVLDRALQLARDALAEVERLTADGPWAIENLHSDLQTAGNALIGTESEALGTLLQNASTAIVWANAATRAAEGRIREMVARVDYEEALARAQAAERENERLRKALRFYRDEAWDLARDGDEETGQITAEWLEPSSALTNDQGSRARQALGDRSGGEE